jgi:hypothetical protein
MNSINRCSSRHSPFKRGKLFFSRYLPQQHAFDIVLRHSFARHQGCMAFGTNAGNPYLSENDGATWQTLSQTLLRVDALVWAD